MPRQHLPNITMKNGTPIIMKDILKLFANRNSVVSTVTDAPSTERFAGKKNAGVNGRHTLDVAVSFSGLPRLRQRAIYSWEGLIRKYNADVFMHIWETDDGETEKVKNIFPMVKFISEPQEIFDTSHYTERLQSSNPQNVFSQWTSIWRSMNLVYSHTKTYDVVVRARLDVEFAQFDFLDTHGVKIPGKPAEVYNWQGKRYPGWHDMIAYGDPDSMRAYTETLWKIPQIYREGSPFFSEFFLSTHLFRSKINTTHHAVFADIVR